MGVDAMRFQVGKGMDEYLSKLGNLEMTAPLAIGRAVYDGAKVVADAVKRNIEALPVDDSPHSEGERTTGLKSIQKEGLKHGFGISRSEMTNGYKHVKLGFSGYNKLKTKKYPSGQPNAMIARTFEGGNSFTKKTPFVGPAVRASRDQAEAAMEHTIDAEINKVMN